MVSPFWGGFFEAARPGGGGGGFAKSNQLSPQQRLQIEKDLRKTKVITAGEVAKTTAAAKLDAEKKRHAWKDPLDIKEETRKNTAALAQQKLIDQQALRQKERLSKEEIKTKKEISLETLSLGERQHGAELKHQGALQVGELAHKKDVVKIEAEAREKMAAKTMQESTFATMKSNFLTRAHKVKAEGWIAKGAKIPISVDMLEAIQNAKNKNHNNPLR